MKARVSFLHKKESDWQQLNSFIPEPGEMIIYDPDEHFSYSRIKIGDGKTCLQELEFIINSAVSAVLSEHRYSEVLDCGRITNNIK